MADAADAASLRALLEEWERGNFWARAELIADDVYFSAVQPEGQLEERGLAAVTRFMREFLTGWRDYRIELHDLEDLGGGRYLATITQHGVGRSSGVAITAPGSIAFSFRAGEIAQMEWHLERDDAIAALERFGRS